LKRFHSRLPPGLIPANDPDHENENQKIIILARQIIPIHDFVKPVSYGRFIQMERRIAQAVKIRL
jgi:hypothetical protein